MNTPTIVTEWMTWYRELPVWQRYAPPAVVVLLLLWLWMAL